MNAAEWAKLMDGPPRETLPSEITPVPADALPPATCARCGKACDCGALPDRYQTLERRPHVEQDADVRDALRQLEPPPERSGRGYRRTRRLTEEERDHLRDLAAGAARDDRPRILPRPNR